MDLQGYDEQMLNLTAQGAAAVAAGAALGCGPFVAPYRRLPLAGHPLNGAHRIDLAFLTAARNFGGDGLLGSSTLRIGAAIPRSYPAVGHDDKGAILRGPRNQTCAADTFALALGLATESQKVLEGLAGDKKFDDVASAAVALGTDTAALLKALGPTASDVLNALSALARGGVDRMVDGTQRSSTVDLDALATHVRPGRAKGPIFVVAGAYERVQDILSPFVRELTSDLGSLAASRIPDALYVAAEEVFALDAEVVEERLTVERKDGFAVCGDVFSLRCEALDPRRCDARAHAAVTALKRNRACIVFVPDGPALHEVLDVTGDVVRAVVLLSEGRLDPGLSARPAVLLDAASGAAMDLDNALLGAQEIATQELPSVALSIPSLGLAPMMLPANVVAETNLATLGFTCARARATGALAHNARIAHGIFSAGDATAPSEVALRVLERMANARAE